jgi:uncharacterized protein (DUF488 family)
VTRNPADDATTSPAPIFTIGYGSRALVDFVRVLQTHNIEYLIDIRSTPYSRFKPEFSKNELEAELRQHNIRYVYFGDKLGGRPADRDCYVGDKVVYARVKEKAFYRDGIVRVEAAFRKRVRIALMCSEGKPAECHRSKLIGESLSELGIPVAHIDENDTVRTQEELMLDLTEGQLNLFGEHEFTSRKRYRAATPGVAAEDSDYDA